MGNLEVTDSGLVELTSALKFVHFLFFPDHFWPLLATVINVFKHSKSKKTRSS
jgi:hypothetical protein